MKDYTLSEEDKSRYILDIHSNPDKTFDVEFADGSVFRGVEATSENYLKVKRILEDQAKKGVENYSVFEGNREKAKVCSALSGLGLATLGVGICSIPKIGDIILREPPVAAICGVTALTVLGTMPSIVKMVKNSKKVDELDKIRYRNDHRRELESIPRYPNSLCGTRESIKTLIRRDRDPFSMLHVDDYSIEDLENIVNNVQKEEDYQFTYKTYKKERKNPKK